MLAIQFPNFGLATGDLSYATRIQRFRMLELKTLKVLITTNILCRGINIKKLQLVINFDAPVGATIDNHNPKAYLNWSGRCGRLGRQGAVVNLVAPFEQSIFTRISEIYKIPLNIYWLYLQKFWTWQWNYPSNIVRAKHYNVCTIVHGCFWARLRPQLVRFSRQTRVFSILKPEFFRESVLT